MSLANPYDTMCCFADLRQTCLTYIGKPTSISDVSRCSSRTNATNKLLCHKCFLQLLVSISDRAGKGMRPQVEEHCVKDTTEEEFQSLTFNGHLDVEAIGDVMRRCRLRWRGQME